MIILVFLFALGGALIFMGGVLALINSNKKCLIISLIGGIIITIGVISLIVADLDCNNYCTCKGYEFHELKRNRCECSNENPIIKRASDECAINCPYNKEAYYNQATGGCYCT